MRKLLKKNVALPIKYSYGTSTETTKIYISCYDKQSVALYTPQAIFCTLVTQRYTPIELDRVFCYIVSLALICVTIETIIHISYNSPKDSNLYEILIIVFILGIEIFHPFYHTLFLTIFNYVTNLYKLNDVNGSNYEGCIQSFPQCTDSKF